MANAELTIEHFSAQIPFWKMNGSGNDFVVVDNREGIIPEALKREWARLVSRQHLAVGADGVVLIELLSQAENADVRWRYFNADGSEGEMCGNGAMCGARFAIEQGIAPNPVRLSTCSGIVQAALEGRQVWLDIPDSGELRMEIEIDGLPLEVTGHEVQVGVPHVVIPVDDADSWPEVTSFDAIGHAIRHHARLFPAGVNVNVVSPGVDGSIRMRTWERGVEAETLACGTGAVASAIIAVRLGMANSPVQVVVSSGRTLSVDFRMSGNLATQIRLGGVASLVTTGVVLPDAWTP